MGRTHLVVDGSNIATEGRTAPSLAQLDEAVRAFIEQQSYEQTVVVVDATFGHRIDPSEVPGFEEAILNGEIVTPPAGTIGRGDAFILQVARQADADVLSNDSFQELHAEHPWLFEAGRLWGGKPVPAVGWVFVARAPVRGVTSRKVVQAAKQAAKKAAKKAAAHAASAATKAPAPSRPPAKASKAAAAAAPPAEPAPAGDGGSSRRRRRRGGGGGGGSSSSGDGGGSQKQQQQQRGGGRLPVNEQLVYAAFVIEHPIGSAARGVVDRFSSHGAYVTFGSAVGYVPLKALGDPPPRSAREILTVGEERDFTVTRFDPTTRGIDVVPSDLGAPTTSVSPAPPADDEAVAVPTAADVPAPDAEEAPVSPVARKAAAKKAAKKKTAAKKAVTRKAAAKKATARKAPARKAAAKKATARKAPARKAAAKKATTRKAAAKRAPAKKATAKKATARKAVAKKAPARKAVAKKAPARKAVAKKR